MYENGTRRGLSHREFRHHFGSIAIAALRALPCTAHASAGFSCDADDVRKPPFEAKHLNESWFEIVIRSSLCIGSMTDPTL